MGELGSTPLFSKNRRGALGFRGEWQSPLIPHCYDPALANYMDVPKLRLLPINLSRVMRLQTCRGILVISELARAVEFLL